jgi:phosphoribosylglycinamide formyltransferase-1
VIRIAALASGNGTNLQALLDACAEGSIDGRIAVVLSNLPGARALARARAAGVDTEVVPSQGVADRAAYDAEILARLASHAPDLICLAGYMRLLTPGFVRAFGPTPSSRGCPRIMNVHPGLLPSFPGLHAQRQALAYGARFAGCTVHFVDEGTDTGPVIVQAVVPILEGDTEEALSARILEEEHRIYPQAVRWFAQGRLELVGRRVIVCGARAPAAPPVLRSPWDD